MDAKDWIALCTSLGSLWWNWRNQRTQDARWKALNNGRVELTKAKVETWREFESREAALAITWGHRDVKLIREFSDPGDVHRLPYSLCVLWRNGKPIPGWNTTTTVTEAVAEGLRHGTPVDRAALVRRFRFSFTIENAGNTDISDLTIVTWQRLQPEGGDWQVIFRSVKPVDLPPKQPGGFYFELFRPIDALFPEMFSFKTKLSYRDSDQQSQTVERTMSWLVQDNVWLPYERDLGTQ